MPSDAKELEARLSSVLVDLASTLSADFSAQSILDRIVLQIVDVLAISAAGVTLFGPVEDATYITGSDQAALRYERLQADLGEGPCLVAAATGRPVAVPDLRVDPRFPKFGSAAVRAGLAGVFTFPLRQGDECFGALDLYQSSAGALDADTVDAAQTLAEVTAAYVTNARVQDGLRITSEQLLHATLHDQLTGLCNRAMLLQRLEEVATRIDRSKAMVAVIYADLDGFKAVNDTYGHLIGDELLVAVARRLSNAIRQGDTLARIGGDEFVVLCQGRASSARADSVVARIRATLELPFALSSGTIAIGIAVGSALAGPEPFDARAVLDAADGRMYRAKRDRHSPLSQAERAWPPDDSGRRPAAASRLDPARRAPPNLA